MVKIPQRLIAKIKPDQRQIDLRVIVGEAIEQYSQVEFTQITLLEVLIDKDMRVSSILHKAMQNVRSRNAMFGDLIALRDASLSPHWKKCAAFLLKLAEFRNAIAHWTFSIVLYTKPDGAFFVVPGLHSIGDDDIKPITEADIADFVKDCSHAIAIINQFRHLIQVGPLTSQDISQIQPVRPNRATLQSDPTPRAQPRQRPPSKPNELQKGRKPSAKQRRQRALSKRQPRQPA